MIMAAVALILAAQASAAPPAPAPAAKPMPPAVGIFDDPCAHVPAMPEPVVTYMATAAKQRAAGQAATPPTPELLKMAADWTTAVNAADFVGKCRYAHDNAALPPATKGRVVFFGDSITENWLRLRPDFFHGDRIDRGISGHTTDQMIGRFRSDVIDLHPAVVHIMAGINDIAGNTGPTSLKIIQNNIMSMAELAKAHGIRVVLASVLPAKTFNWRPDMQPVPSVLAINAWLKDYAKTNGFTFVDYFTAMDDGQHGLDNVLSLDGVHPSVKGYAVMEPLAEKAIAAALAKK